MAYLARAARRDSIVEAAATVVARAGLSAVTARTVASELGGSPGQIHHHFASTDELAAEAWRRYAAREIEAYQRAIVDLDQYTALTLFFSDLVGEGDVEGHALARWAEAGAHAQIRGPIAVGYVETLAQLTDVLTAVLSGDTDARAAAGRLLMLGVGLAGITRITDDPPLPVRTIMLSAIRAEID
ncbi:TetR family transcriptional regulator [Nocardia neocaledoniensis NBRC 108232]|uniref:TetR family transcriptional regulator n=1 Tax=Nocardia neocaledoniensis TaxID=236511 RepID=A0A317NV83_9NOCA|nr:TetR/AcrR family transcriptional regulator [Nocardia neocaledoniensis]PWV78945.1 TetR family transcriptional regulator [Nocardia neocaledoniensis]GEM35301.1 TetR family transcriptional regulator [Nocardia neocaledoniensis NBRC 108232]